MSPTQLLILPMLTPVTGVCGLHYLYSLLVVWTTSLQLAVLVAPSLSQWASQLESFLFTVKMPRKEEKQGQHLTYNLQLASQSEMDPWWTYILKGRGYFAFFLWQQIDANNCNFWKMCLG